MDKFIASEHAPYGEGATIAFLSNEHQQDKNLHAHYLVQNGLSIENDPGVIDYLCSACLEDIPANERDAFQKSQTHEHYDKCYANDGSLICGFPHRLSPVTYYC